METQQNEKTVLLITLDPRSTTDEDEEGEGEEDGNSNKDQFCRSKLSSLAVGCLLLLLLITSYVISAAASQAIGRQTSIFMLNIYRYSVLGILSIVLSSVLKFSVSVERKDVFRFVIAIFFNYIKSTLFYLAAAYLPLGNLGAVFTGVYLLLCSGADFMWTEISKVALLVITFCLIGVTLVAQPWQMEKDPVDFNHWKVLPCVFSVNVTHENSSRIFPNSSDIDVNYVGDWLGNYWIHPTVLGYIYILVAAACSTVSTVVSRSILQSYNAYCFFFWASILQTLMSALMVIILKFVDDVHLSVPSDASCLGLTILFIFATVVYGVCCNFIYLFLPSSNVAFGKPFALVILYILQLTLFHQFYPGLGNASEIVGIVLVILASIMSPLSIYLCVNETGSRSK